MASKARFGRGRKGRSGAPPAITPPAGKYVATNGNDNNLGTFDQPWRTLTYAVQQLVPGDALYVRAGTYAEDLDGMIAPGTSWALPVRVIGYAAETVWLAPTSGSHVLHFTGTQQYIEVNRINLNGSLGIGSDTVKIEQNPGNYPHHIRLTTLELIGNPTQAADFLDSPHGVLNSPSSTAVFGDITGSNEFLNLQIHGTAAYGLYIGTPSNLIQNCEIYDTHGFGIHLFSDDFAQAPSNNTINRNEIHDILAGADRTRGMLFNGTGNLIMNNIVYNLQTSSFVRGIEPYTASVNARVYHNTVYGTPQDGIYNQGSGSLIKNNISYGNSGSNFVEAGSGSTVSNNSWQAPVSNANPLFVNVGAANFHLQAGSPCVDVGVSLADVTADFDSVARANPPDLGAYEQV